MPGCARGYWKGSHWTAMVRQIEALCPPAPAGGVGPLYRSIGNATDHRKNGF